MQAYKLEIPNPEISKLVQLKAFSIGYHWGIKTREITNEDKQALFFNNDGSIGWSGLYYLDSEPFNRTRIPYQDFLKIGEELNINNNNMPDQNEIELTLVKEPKKAKNLTVGNVYKGIYIDDEETQVDHLKDAKYFFCVNDSGKEARYSIDLFGSAEEVAQKPVVKAPVAPPRPRELSLDEILETIEYGEESVSAVFVENGPRIRVLRFGYGAFCEDSSSISCGVSQLWYLNSTFDEIRDSLTIPGAGIPAKRKIFKEMLKARINNSDESGKFIVMSTQTSEQDVCIAVDELTELFGGCSITGVNPNSHNEIKVWTIVKP